MADSHVLAALIHNKLSVDSLKTVTVGLVDMAEQVCPGASVGDKESWATRQLTAILERFDNSVPIVGALLDTPIADRLEADLVGRVVKWGFQHRA